MNNEIIKYTTLESDRNRWQTTNQKHNANSITSISNEVSRRNRSLGLRTFHKISTLAQLRNLFNKTNTLQNWDKRILQPSYQSRSVFRSLERKREKERERERNKKKGKFERPNPSSKPRFFQLETTGWHNSSLTIFEVDKTARRSLQQSFIARQIHFVGSRPPDVWKAVWSILNEAIPCLINIHKRNSIRGVNSSYRRIITGI